MYEVTCFKGINEVKTLLCEHILGSGQRASKEYYTQVTYYQQHTAWLCVADSHTLQVVKCFFLLMPESTQNFPSLTKVLSKFPEV